MAHVVPFLRAFARNCRHVGAVAPSSPALAAAMIDWMDWDRIETLLEVGPGTGAFTSVIESRAASGTRIVAIERDPELAEITGQRCPAVSVHQDCVSNAREIFRGHGIETADAIVCSLPWASLEFSVQEACLEAMLGVLRPGGEFASFAYLQGLALPAGRRFRKVLGERFSSLDPSPPVWRNFPPALVYRCRR